MQIKMNAAISTIAVIKIISSTGQIMYTAKLPVFKGMNNIEVNNLSAKIAKGVYILAVTFNNQNFKVEFVF